MNVSVIIPVKDDERVFACIASVLACEDEATSLEVIVVDNRSEAGFLARLAQLPSGAHVLTIPEPGAYAARNAGIAAATGELILFTDADCIARPGWIKAAISCGQGRAAIVQGYSGTLSRSLHARLIQGRYEAHLRHIRPGAATECDTRNLAVRREVFGALQFNASYRRVGDTEFGLLAEDAGFRVAFCPDMRVDHDHDQDFRLFAAKQVCHGWGAQRLMHEHPQLRWHGGLMRPVSLAIKSLGWLPGVHLGGRLLSSATIAAAALLERTAPRLPFKAALFALMLVDKAAGLAGHLLFAPDSDEPSPSVLLNRRLPRD